MCKDVLESSKSVEMFKLNGGCKHKDYFYMNIQKYSTLYQNEHL